VAPEIEPSPSTRRRAVREVLVYGLAGGAAIAFLKLVEAHFLGSGGSRFELYAGVVAVVFAGVGIWLGSTLRPGRAEGVVREGTVEVPVAEEFVRDEARAAELGLTPREIEILEQVAAGLSNREIAAALFVSENTVKTHVSRLFDKLGARRRTQAVQIGQESGLIP